jgi:hypothetical protein
MLCSTQLVPANDPLAGAAQAARSREDKTISEKILIFIRYTLQI